MERLARIATAARRPVQFVFAGRVHAEDDARTLYSLIEERIVPAFYDRNRAQVPDRWTTLVRETLADALPRCAARTTLTAGTGA